ncbi:MAG: penicillin-binding transpeptidase domain-containing protein [Limnochordia bacterium]|jgi:stage V sporulation protein D (sporulation-specific penicillin-binding protein)
MAKVPLLTVRRRISGLLVAAVLFSLFLGGRLVYLQLARYEFFTEKGLQQRMRPIPIDARRGTIYDRNGHILAESVSASAVFAIPAEVEEPAQTAEKLAQLLDLDYDFVYKRLTKRSAAEWIKKRVTEAEAQAVYDLELAGIGVVENPVRHYPMGSIAPQVLGIVGIDNQGLEGIELFYDRELRGVPGRLLVERDAAGRQIPHGIEEYIPPVDGYDLVLTIDQHIQRIAQREVERAVAQTGSVKGLILIADPKTGAILASAQVPNYDLTDYQAYPAANRRLMAITDPYEPGSSFKAVTAAIALETGVASLNRGFFDPGYVMISGWRVRCWFRGGHGPQTFVQTLENSCNPAFATMGVEIGPERFYDYLHRFGFGKPLGLDLPGESGGKIRKPGPNIPLVTWGNIGFGQGLMITPLQLVAAYSAIANGGTLLRPYLVQEIRDREGNVIYKNEPEMIGQPVSKEVADKVRMALRSVIVNGSGKRAEAPGYRVAGKTGTAQLVEGGRYSHTKMASSFAGFAPADDPVMTGLLVLWEPKGAFFGGIIAAPVFSRLAGQILPYLGVAPQRRGTEDRGGVEVVVPPLQGTATDEAFRILQQMGLRASVLGEGPRIIDQTPLDGAQVQRGTKVYLYTDPSSFLEEGIIVPMSEEATWSPLLVAP